jgi:hypothetical protein
MFIGVSMNPVNFCHVDIIDCRELKHTEDGRVAPTVMILMKSFMKIHQLIQKLARMSSRPQTLLREESSVAN